jgi:hypothetical protein
MGHLHERRVPRSCGPPGGVRCPYGRCAKEQMAGWTLAIFVPAVPRDPSRALRVAASLAEGAFEVPEPSFLHNMPARRSVWKVWTHVSMLRALRLVVSTVQCVVVRSSYMYVHAANPCKTHQSLSDDRLHDFCRPTHTRFTTVKTGSVLAGSARDLAACDLCKI